MTESTRDEIYSWIKAIFFAILLVFLMRQFLFVPMTVFGVSMAPTYEDHDRIIVSKVSDIERFDVIVFNAPDSDERYIKRVIGLPGDNIEVEDDVLYINGVPYQEPYLKNLKKQYPFNKLTGDFSLDEIIGLDKVPPGTLFVLGDNRIQSKDSRYFGCIDATSVIGEVKFRVYPFEAMGMPH